MSLNMIIDFSTIVVIGLLIIAQRRILRGLRDHRKPQVVDLKRVHIEKGDILIFETDGPISDYAVNKIRLDARTILDRLGWTSEDVQTIVLDGSILKINKVLGRKE